MAVGNSLGIPAKQRKVNDAGGVLPKRVVVQGTGKFEVKNPAAANAGKIAGVVEYLGAKDGADTDFIGVRDHGEAVCVAAAAIAVGDYVNIAGVSGKVKTISETAGTAVLVGRALTSAAADGDEITVDLRLLETLR